MESPASPEKKNCLAKKLLKRSVDNPHCKEMISKYEKLHKIGMGPFGEIFKGRDRQTSQYVALKKVSMENLNEGFPVSAVNEIKALQSIKHQNIVNLIEVCKTQGPSFYNIPTSIYFLVCDFWECDLSDLLTNVHIKFLLSEIKMVMKQLLTGLCFIHSKKILHGDIKSANILLTESGVLKIANFSLSRILSTTKNGQTKLYTNRVGTLWYRSPEILLGDRNYGHPVDMWSAGCTMAEMWIRSPIMQGNTEQQQLTVISELCGSINSETFSRIESLDLFNHFELPRNQNRKLKERLKDYVMDPNALDLLDKLLTIDPVKRLASGKALNHAFFESDPLPSELQNLLSFHSQSMFESLATNSDQNQHEGAVGHHSSSPIS